MNSVETMQPEPVLLGSIHSEGYCEAQARAKVIAVAREWIHTPYFPCVARKGRGCDCGSLLSGVYAECGIIPQQARHSYDWMAAWAKRGGDAFFLREIMEHGREIPERSAQPADIAMFKLGRGWSHAAIIASWPNEIIHAMRSLGVVSSSAKWGPLVNRPVRFFTVF